MNFAKPGPKSTKGPIPNLPEMVSLLISDFPDLYLLLWVFPNSFSLQVSDEEAQRTARKSALIVARMKDGTFKAEVRSYLAMCPGFGA